jgi:hypothetical protein
MSEILAKVVLPDKYSIPPTITDLSTEFQLSLKCCYLIGTRNLLASQK